MKDTGPMPKARICKAYFFSAGHWLPNVPVGHPCRNQHGHNYRVEIIACGEMEQNRGWLVDFAELDRYAKPIIAQLDHKNLNDILENPTAEWIAWWIHARMPVKYVESVKVWETDKCWAQTTGKLPEWLRGQLGWSIDSSSVSA